MFLQKNAPREHQPKSGQLDSVSPERVPTRVRALRIGAQAVSALAVGAMAIGALAPVCSATGQAAGTAAALAVRAGVTPGKLDVSVVQKVLATQGVDLGM